MSGLLGKVAFITGAGSGIGRGTAERLAREGADVCILDLDEDGAEMTANLVTQLGRRAHVVKTNITSAARALYNGAGVSVRDAAVNKRQ